MILEFAALSRLSGESVFEEKASHAMDVLWSSRHRQSNLVGNVVNIHSGDWVRRDSGVGAGIDSYYEYVAKAYVLLGDDKYLERWQTHYDAIMKYLVQAGGGGPLLQDVHMHRPQTVSKHFYDSLAAFWPGLQVLMGDLEPAVRSHEVHYQVMKRHNFIPEAFTADYQVHWGQAFLRPEFVESTYFLYRATHDPHYLEVGRDALRSIQQHARVTCGYATIKDVRTLQKEDRMDSFVLSETFKYLYLLFAEESELVLDINDFVFTTEAHLLPLALARLSNRTAVPLKTGQTETWLDEDVDNAMSCPSTHFLFPNHHHQSGKVDSAADFARSLRHPLANHVTDKCPVAKSPPKKRKLLASDFQQGNQEHLKLLSAMGISLVSLPDGRVQLLHSFANAASSNDGEEGLLFMQEMIELSKQSSEQALPETPPKLVSFRNPSAVEGETGTVAALYAGPAQFGKLIQDGYELSGKLTLADPATACKDISNGDRFKGKIVLVSRGDCMFIGESINFCSFLVGRSGGFFNSTFPTIVSPISMQSPSKQNGSDSVQSHFFTRVKCYTGS